MRQPDLLKFLNGVMPRIEMQTRAGRAVAHLDNCIAFVAKPGAYAANPALGAVRTPVLFGFWLIAALVLVTIVWGSLVPIASAASAHGSVVLYNSKKTIQHLEGGVIDEILVKEGDKVKQGQPLIHLRDTAPDAARDSIQLQLYTERANEKRLAAELNGNDSVYFDNDMLERSIGYQPLADILSAQRQLFNSERAEEASKIGQLDQRIAQSREEIKGLQAEGGGASSQMELFDKEIASVQDLLQKGYATETRLLTLQRNRSEMLGSKGQYEAQAAKSEEGITETQMAIVNEKKDFETKTLKDLHDSQTKIVDFKNKLRTAGDVEDRTLITAPNEGIVTGLRYHTVGGVITPGSAVMDIIPQSDDLIVEAHVRPADISVVKEGLEARIIFTSYKMRTTPRIPGKVVQVSADVFNDEHNPNATPYYTARIEVDKDFLKRLTQPIELRPGMPVEVMIRTGSRSFMGYMLKPVADSMHSAFREQ